MSDKKSNLKSIRLSDKVLGYINGYRGNGFNEKFENIILDAMESEDKRIVTLAKYDMEIEEKKHKYYKMCEQLRQLQPSVQVCINMVDRLIGELDRQVDDCNSN